MGERSIRNEHGEKHAHLSPRALSLIFIGKTGNEGVLSSIPKYAQIFSPVDKEVDKEFCSMPCVDLRDSIFLICTRNYRHVTSACAADSVL